MKSISEMAQTIGIVSFQQEHETSIHQHSCLILEANVYLFFYYFNLKECGPRTFFRRKKMSEAEYFVLTGFIIDNNYNTNLLNRYV